VYVRQAQNENVIVVLNNSSKPADIAVPFGVDRTYKSLLEGIPDLIIKNASGIVHLPAYSAVIFRG